MTWIKAECRVVNGVIYQKVRRKGKEYWRKRPNYKKPASFKQYINRRIFAIGVRFYTKLGYSPQEAAKLVYKHLRE